MRTAAGLLPDLAGQPAPRLSSCPDMFRRSSALQSSVPSATNLRPGTGGATLFEMRNLAISSTVRHMSIMHSLNNRWDPPPNSPCLCTALPGTLLKSPARSARLGRLIWRCSAAMRSRMVRACPICAEHRWHASMGECVFSV